MQNESSALTFGSAIHKALEHWYQLPTEARILDPKLYEKAELLAFASVSDLESARAEYAIHPMGSIAEFVVAAQGLKDSPNGDKRSIDNGITILRSYFKHYAADGLEVYRDEKGPVIERDFSFTMFSNAEFDIEYFGRIDCVLWNPITKVKMVVDHKTTASLGRDFFNRIKPNHQYTGYIMGAASIGIETNLFMVNGLQVAKTKQEFARQVTDRNKVDFYELNVAAFRSVVDFKTSNISGFWPMTAPGPCSNYGGCKYLDICSVPESIRKTVIEAKYNSTVAAS